MGQRVTVDQIDFIPISGTFQSNRNISAVVTLSPPANSEATKIMLQALTQNVRYTLDGSNPSPGDGEGFQLKAGDPPTIIPYYSGFTILKVRQEAPTASLQEQWGK